MKCFRITKVVFSMDWQNVFWEICALKVIKS